MSAGTQTQLIAYAEHMGRCFSLLLCCSVVLDCCMECSSSAVHQIMNKKKASPLMVMLSGVVGAGGGATPLVTGLDGVWNMRSVNENVPLSTVISLKRLSSFQAAVSSSNSLPEGQHTHAPCSGKQHNHSCSHYCGYETHSKPNQSHLNRQLFPAPAACL